MLKHLTPAEQLAEQWLDLFATKTNKPVNDKKFLAKYQAVDKARLALNDEERAIFTALTNKRVKELLRPSEPISRKVEQVTWR